MSVICVLVATGMRCPPQGNPEPGTAGDRNKDVRGKTGEPRLELVSGRAKVAEYFQITGLKELCQLFGSQPFC